MKETWRWFGSHDTISSDEIRQTGAKGIVSSLYGIPPGTVWSRDQIRAHRIEIEGDEQATGLTWDVVESLPVSEAIKTASEDRPQHVEAFCESLRNIAAEGVSIVCYNFMPVLDWTRTAFDFHLPYGGKAMAFDLVDFALFDIHLLKRQGAEEDYSEAIVSAARARTDTLDQGKVDALCGIILAGLPGTAEEWTLSSVKSALENYTGIAEATLRKSLSEFLQAVVPTAEEVGVRLCCHPDDPPFPLLGLPRIVSTEEDYAALLSAVDSPANGITFCTGSLGVRPEFDPERFVERLGHRIHFAHLRNTARLEVEDRGRFSFVESEHLDGDTDLLLAVKALLAEQSRRRVQNRPDHEIPMRPDHGHVLLDDANRATMPGYPLIGRMRALAELRGAIKAMTRPMASTAANDRIDM